MRYITEEDFEMLIQNAAKKTDRDPDEIRVSVRKFLTEERGVTISIPLMEKIRQAQVRAAENVVILNLDRTLGGSHRVSTDELFSQIKSARVKAGEDTIIRDLCKKGVTKHGLRVVE